MENEVTRTGLGDASLSHAETCPRVLQPEDRPVTVQTERPGQRTATDVLTGDGPEALGTGSLAALVGLESVRVTVPDGSARARQTGVQCAKVYARERWERALSLLLGCGSTASVFVDFIAVVQLLLLAFIYCGVRSGSN
jgi:hypothetical protein